MTATAARPGSTGADGRAERFARPVLLAFLLVAAADLAGLLAGAETVHLVAKPLLMPLLAGYAALRGAPGCLSRPCCSGGAATSSCSPTTTWPSSSAWGRSPSAMSAT